MIGRFAHKHAVLFSVAVAVSALLLWGIDLDGDPLGGLDMLCAHALTSGLCLLLIRRLDLWKDAGFSGGAFGRGLLLGLPFLVIGLVSAWISNDGLSFGTFIGVPGLLLFTANMLLVGVGEELAYRGLVLNHLLAAWGRDRRGTMRAVLVSAAVFGLSHLPNMAFAPPVTVMVQAINAASGGVLFSAVYLRCRNIWAVAVVHALVDWIALAAQACFAGSSMTEARNRRFRAIEGFC